MQERSKRAGLLRVDAPGQLRVDVRLQHEIRPVPRRLRHPGEDAPDVCKVVSGIRGFLTGDTTSLVTGEAQARRADS